ncbi:MAG: hypothetical protein ABI399_12740 [Bauldia sp.]
MGRFVRVLGRILLAVILVGGVLLVATEGLRRQTAVRHAVEAVKAEAKEQRQAAIAKAVAAAEAKVSAEAPVLPTIDTMLDADDETRALFPEDAYLAEVSGKYQEAKCREQLDMVYWLRLEPRAGRSTIERQRPDGTRALAGLLTFGLSEFYAPQNTARTIFAAKTDGPYTTFILGALRKGSDEERVSMQTRLTLYRLDNASFAVVQWAPVDEPPAARPQNRAPKFSKVLRRCQYRDGASEL